MTNQHKNKTAWNDVTGDSIKTGKGSQSAYEKGYAGIDWGKKSEKPVESVCKACNGEGGFHDCGWWYECPTCHPEAYTK